MFTVIKNLGLQNLRVMVFVDGENLAIRCSSMLSANTHTLQPNAKLLENVYVWSPLLTRTGVVSNGAILRTYFYTVVQGDYPRVEEVAADLKSLGVGAPRVFKKDRGKPSKRVDITLATDMLLHAARRNYDIAVLAAGDEDYVPLVEAVQAEGRGVHVWSVPDGLSSKLVQAADEFFDLSNDVLLRRADA